MKKRIIGLLALILVALLLNNFIVMAQETQPQTQAAIGDSEGNSFEEMYGLYGSPWVTAMDSGNLPEEAPEAVDDLILHYTYDIVKENQGTIQYEGMTKTEGELKEFMTAYLQDESHDSHEMQQMRILFDQAADFEALKAAGLSELQPYLDMVTGAQSIEELNISHQTLS